MYLTLTCIHQQLNFTVIIFWVKFLSETCHISEQHLPPCCLAVCTVPCYFPQPVWILPWLPGLEHCSLSRLKWLESITHCYFAASGCLILFSKASWTAFRWKSSSPSSISPTPVSQPLTYPNVVFLPTGKNGKESDLWWRIGGIKFGFRFLAWQFINHFNHF